MYRPLRSLLILLLIIVAGCSSGPQPINYGNELCHHCKMTISDSRFGSELVTDKGKAFKYDAIECMLMDLPNHSGETYTLYVSDFLNPGKLIPAKSATFLISQEIPSPMGVFVSGYGSEEDARGQQQQFGGNLFDLEALKNHLQ